MTSTRLCLFLLYLVAATAKHPLLVLAVAAAVNNGDNAFDNDDDKNDDDKNDDDKNDDDNNNNNNNNNNNIDNNNIPQLSSQQPQVLPTHMQTTHPLLQIPCAIQLATPLSPHPEKRTSLGTYVDTGAQVSVLSVQAAGRAGVLQMMDRRYAGHAQGVGHCRVLGRVPAGALLLHLHNGISIEAPAVTILERTNDGVDLLLGLDFLRDHGAILNLRTEQMVLQSTSNKGTQILIPFIRPRSPLHFGGGGDTMLGGEHHHHDDDDDDDNCYQDQRLCMHTDDEEEEEEETLDGIDMSGV